MYILRKNQLIERNREALMSPVIAPALQRLAEATRGLVFDPGPHRYRLERPGEEPRELDSVSTVVGEYAGKNSRTLAEKATANPRSQWHGKPVEEILAAWEVKRDASAEAGTQVHEFGEQCFNFLTGQPVEERYSRRVTPDGDGLMAIHPKEIAAARWWAEQDWNDLVPVAKETRVMNLRYGYAGTFDLLLYRISTGRFPLKDYKTNGDLDRDFGDKMRPPFSMFPDTDRNKYILQQNMYDLPMAAAEVETDSISLIWLKDDCTYEDSALPKIGRLMTSALEARISKTLTLAI